MLQPGITGSKAITVQKEHTAAFLGSGLLHVFATPAMVALMEGTAMESVLEYLEEGEGTVGTAINVRHTAATPLGMTVRCESRLLRVEGRMLSFAISVFDDVEQVGSATHTRYLIENERFLAKTQGKLKR